MRSKVQNQLVDICSAFPRLLYLSLSEMLAVATHSASPISLLPVICKIFPSVHNLSVVEVEMDMQEGFNPVAVQASYQIVQVYDQNKEPLRLCVPLPITGRKAVEWLGALERAMRYSLACHLTTCATSFPPQLLLLESVSDEGLPLHVFLSSAKSLYTHVHILLMELYCEFGNIHVLSFHKLLLNTILTFINL